MVGSLLCDGLPPDPTDTEDAAEQRAHQEVAAEDDSQREEVQEADYDDPGDTDSADPGSHESEPTDLDVNKRKRSRPNSPSVEQRVREDDRQGMPSF